MSHNLGAIEMTELELIELIHANFPSHLTPLYSGADTDLHLIVATTTQSMIILIKVLPLSSYAI